MIGMSPFGAGMHESMMVEHGRVRGADGCVVMHVVVDGRGILVRTRFDRLDIYDMLRWCM